MPRSKRAAMVCALTAVIALPVALGASAGDSMAPPRGATQEEIQARHLRQQIKRERRQHRSQIRALTRTVQVVRHQYGTDKIVQSAITLAAMTYGVDRNWMEAIIQRESRFRPWAINPSSGACGLAQFLHSTWVHTPQGAAGMDCTDPLANAMAMAWLASQPGGRHNWDL